MASNSLVYISTRVVFSALIMSAIYDNSYAQTSTSKIVAVSNWSTISGVKIGGKVFTLNCPAVNDAGQTIGYSEFSFFLANLNEVNASITAYKKEAGVGPEIPVTLPSAYQYYAWNTNDVPTQQWVNMAVDPNFLQLGDYKIKDYKGRERSFFRKINRSTLEIWYGKDGFLAKMPCQMINYKRPPDGV